MRQMHRSTSIPLTGQHLIALALIAIAAALYSVARYLL